MHACKCVFVWLPLLAILSSPSGNSCLKQTQMVAMETTITFLASRAVSLLTEGGGGVGGGAGGGGGGGRGGGGGGGGGRWTKDESSNESEILMESSLCICVCAYSVSICLPVQKCDKQKVCRYQWGGKMEKSRGNITGCRNLLCMWDWGQGLGGIKKEEDKEQKKKQRSYSPVFSPFSSFDGRQTLATEKTHAQS